MTHAEWLLWYIDKEAAMKQDTTASPLDMFDDVIKPEHYNMGGIECIDGIRESMSKTEYEGHLKGTVIKYLWRYRYKGKPLQDLEKAQWYLNKLIESVDS